MSMFPGAGAQVYYNEAGEPLGWDTPSEFDPNEAQDREDDRDDDRWEDEGDDEDDGTEALQGATGDPLIDAQDLHQDKNYCRHGNFIGNPFGGDYLCGPCEMGE